MHIEEDVSLKPYTTFYIGGAARFFCRVHSIEEMQEALAYSYQKKIPFHILGKGSNSLFDDRGFLGLVIYNKIDFLHIKENDFYVGAGYSFSHLGVRSARLGFSGLEFASGIPASVGGAIYMNAGANGYETQDCLTDISFVDDKGELFHYKTWDIDFYYRFSSFQKMRGAIVAANFRLTKDNKAKDKQWAILKYRHSTQPYGKKSAGCIFQNPTGNQAGALIDQAGLKGARIGGAKVSDLHANFFLNDNQATANEMKTLIEKVKKEVFIQFKVELHSELQEIPYQK